MPRRKYAEDELPTYGRPAKDPLNRVGVPVRALVTPRVVEALVVIQESAGLSTRWKGRVTSDVVRMGLYQLLVSRGLMTPELAEDDTWESLRERGLV